MLRIRATIGVIGIALALTYADAQKQSKKPIDRISAANHHLAISFVRLINYAELDEKLQNDTYVSFSQLAEDGYFDRVEDDNPGAFFDVLGKVNTNNEDQPIPGWELTFISSSDSYSVSLREIKEACPITISTNERGAISEEKEPACTR